MKNCTGAGTSAQFTMCESQATYNGQSGEWRTIKDTEYNALGTSSPGIAGLQKSVSLGYDAIGNILSKSRRYYAEKCNNPS